MLTYLPLQPLLMKSWEMPPAGGADGTAAILIESLKKGAAETSGLRSSFFVFGKHFRVPIDYF